MRVGACEAAIDLYAVLGVARSATAADIRRAHRRLALAHHPDRCRTEEARRDAEAATKRINLAAAVLLDESARARYERLRGAPVSVPTADYWPFVRSQQGPPTRVRVDPPAWEPPPRLPNRNTVQVWVMLGATFVGLILAVAAFVGAPTP
jgi:curved DNA-binding protein CbpA